MEVTSAARQIVKRLVEKAEEQMEPTQEELTGLCVELEREAKFNVVSKDMKTVKKMEMIKERQMAKWKQEFNEFLIRQKKEKIEAKRKQQRQKLGYGKDSEKSGEEREKGPFQRKHAHCSHGHTHDNDECYSVENTDEMGGSEYNGSHYGDHAAAIERTI